MEKLIGSSAPIANPPNIVSRILERVCPEWVIEAAAILAFAVFLAVGFVILPFMRKPRGDWDKLG